MAESSEARQRAEEVAYWFFDEFENGSSPTEAELATRIEQLLAAEVQRAVAEENEACAVEAERHLAADVILSDLNLPLVRDERRQIAAAIRARQRAGG